MRKITTYLGLMTLVAACNGGAAEDARPSDSLPGECAEEVSALAEELSRAGGGCSVIVRMPYNDSHRARAYQVICGPRQEVSEAQARAAAEEDTGYGASATVLNPPGPEDVYVFHSPAADFGGAAVVSADTGLTLFGGSMVWSGQGQVIYPAEWRPPVELGTRCPESEEGIAASRGYNLGNAMTLDPLEYRPALNTLAGTAVPEAMWSSGGMSNVVVLMYPPEVGPIDPEVAEWVVIANSAQP